MSSAEGGRSSRELAEFEQRIATLRQARDSGQADVAAILSAALIELDFAAKALRNADQSEAAASPAGGPRAAQEQAMLRQAFLDAPVPMLILEVNGVVHRVNRAAAVHFDVPPGSFTGKPLTAFIEPSCRAALHSHLVAAGRGDQMRPVNCRLAGGSGLVGVSLSLTRLTVPGLASDALLAIGWPSGATVPDPTATASYPAECEESPDLFAASRRWELLAALGRLLLGAGSEDAPLPVSILLRRAARLLLGVPADWVLVDLLGEESVDRIVALGSAGSAGPAAGTDVPSTETEEDARELYGALPGSLFREVVDSGRVVLHSRVDDLGILGWLADERPLLLATEASSVLAVPLRADDRTLGVLTLLRRACNPPFTMVELALVEEAGVQLALALRRQYQVHRREEIVEVLAGSLRPDRLPTLPGIDSAAIYLTAAEEVDVGGDFYDVFASPGGWGFALGDVCGKGEAAAAVTALVRPAIRLLSLTQADPTVVLQQVHTALRAQRQSRYVTCVAGHLRWMHDVVQLDLVTAGHVPPYVLDSTGRLRQLSGGGQPLGLLPELTLSHERLTLRLGDTLVLYSDGLLDARDSAGCWIGDDAIAESLVAGFGLPAAALLERLERRVLEHCAGHCRDDIAVLALKVTGR